MLGLGMSLARKAGKKAGPPPYQQWENYQDSPELSKDYPYQAISIYSGTTYLLLSPEPIGWVNSQTYFYTAWMRYTLVGASWSNKSPQAGSLYVFNSFAELNHDIGPFSKTTA